jgi:hypothetical protein
MKGLSFAKKAGLILIGLYSLVVFSYGIYGGLTGSSDQKSFYYTSKLLIEKKDPYALGCDFIKQVPANVAYIYYKGINQAGGISLYPPSAHILFIPFFFFLVSPKAAIVSWLLWNIIFIATIFYTISQKYLLKTSAVFSYLLLCLTIGASSTKTNLSLGQTALFCCAAFLVTIVLKEKHKWFSGLAFAFAVSKPSLMILFAIYLLFKKEYKILLVALFIHVCITIAVSFWIGISPVLLMSNYFEKVSLAFSHPGSLLVLQTAGISVKSILYLIKPSEVVQTSVIILLYSVAIIYLYKKRNIEEVKLLGLIALVTLLVDYHHHYDFIILLLMFPVFAGCAEQKHAWQLPYFIFLMYFPNVSRMNLFGYATDKFFLTHMNYLFYWQVFYTGLYVFLLLVYMNAFSRKYISTSP